MNKAFYGSVFLSISATLGVHKDVGGVQHEDLRNLNRVPFGGVLTLNYLPSNTLTAESRASPSALFTLLPLPLLILILLLALTI
jgi:hypothetical protein